MGGALSLAHRVFGTHSLLFLFCFLLLIVMATPLVQAQDSPSTATPSVEGVRLVVKYGDGVEKHFTRLPWSEGATVLDVLQAAARHPRGIRFKHRGDGATLLVTQIDDLANESGLGEGHNWIYRVNDRMGERSAGICPVQPGDTVLWSFERYR